MNKPASNQIVTREDHPIAPVDQSMAIVQLVERLAMNPDVDPDKIERLLAIQERIMAKQAEAEFNRAMRDAQRQMRRIGTDSNNPQTRSRYASYAALDRALRPVYTDAGFSISFDTGEAPQPEWVRVLAYVSHEAGYTRTYHADMPADGKGAKGGDVMTKTHAAGSAMSYGARYLLKMIFNVAVGEDDDDGNSASKPIDYVSEEQAKMIHAELKTLGEGRESKFLGYYKIPSVEHLQAAAYEDAMAMIGRIKARESK